MKKTVSNYMNKYAPIVIFIYNRPDHLKRTLENLKLCKAYKDSLVIVYADGAKNINDRKAVKATRKIATEMLGDHAEYHFSDINKGLSKSVIEGVTSVVNRYGKVIVLEDDLIVSSNFLTYMNDALTRYENDDQVYQVSGYQFGTPEFINKESALFLPITVSWGWATWKRAWHEFDPTAKGWQELLKNKKLRKKFNLDGTYDYSTMLLRQMMGLRDSWAVRWYWTVFNKQGIILFPPYTLVNNTGFDGSGTHGRGVLRQYGDNNKILGNQFELPSSINIDNDNYIMVKRSIYRSNGHWYGFFIDKIRWLTTIRKIRLP